MQAYPLFRVYANVLYLSILFLTYTIKVTNTRLEQRRRVLDKSEAVGRIETETLVNYETVVMFGREKKEVDAYDIVRKEYTKERVKMLGLFSLLQYGQQSIRLAGTCIGLWLAGRATVYGVGGRGDDLLSPGSFVIVQLYIQQLFQPLSFLGFTYRQLTEAMTDLEKAVAMLRSKPLVVDADDAMEWDDALKQQQKKGLSADASSGEITFDNVTFRYNIKTQRKNQGGPDSNGKSSSGKGGSGQGKGRRGFGHKGLWGGRGRAMWGGKGGGNFWLKDANKEVGPTEGDVPDEKVEVGGIQNVSFNIPAGKTAALVGPSKCHLAVEYF